jgi:hypothetical protein
MIGSGKTGKGGRRTIFCSCRLDLLGRSNPSLSPAAAPFACWQDRGRFYFGPIQSSCGLVQRKPEYNSSVVKAALVALASIAVLQGSLLAQRAAGGVHGGGAGVHSGVGGRAGARRGVGAQGFRRNRAGSFFSPYYDGFGFDSGGETAPLAEPPIVIQRAPDPPIPDAQVIEVPAFANSNVPKVLPPPTIFILANGERLESRRFVLTASLLSVSGDRQHRNVPLESLDLNATVAANRERGIDLRIPDDRNEISLGF